MRKIQETLQVQSTTDQDIMYIAFELSNSTEDARHLHREIETLLRERTRYRNRIKALLYSMDLM